MKIRFKIEDLVNMAVSRNYWEVMMKYKLIMRDMKMGSPVPARNMVAQDKLKGFYE